MFSCIFVQVRCLEELSDDLKTIVVGGVTLSPCLQIGGKYDSPAKRALAYFIVDVSREGGQKCWGSVIYHDFHGNFDSRI